MNYKHIRYVGHDRDFPDKKHDTTMGVSADYPLPVPGELLYGWLVVEDAVELQEKDVIQAMGTCTSDDVMAMPIAMVRGRQIH
jgi:hypothetical protein